MREPYYGFYRIFKEQPWSRMIAIGYSFRDEPVNIAIAENLERIKDSTLVLLDPEPQKAIQNFDSASKFGDRIIAVQGRFGDEKILKDSGVDFLIIQHPECIELMEKFIEENPEKWNEDIGE